MKGEPVRKVHVVFLTGLFIGSQNTGQRKHHATHVFIYKGSYVFFRFFSICLRSEIVHTQVKRMTSNGLSKFSTSCTVCPPLLP